MKKALLLFLSLLCVALLALGLVACEDIPTDETPSDDIPTDETLKDNGEEIHNFSTQWTSNGESHFHKCLDGGCTEVKDETPHDFGEWVVDEEATCKSTGVRHRVCTVCERFVNESIPVDKTSHRYAADFTKEGARHYRKCLNAGCTAIVDESTHTFLEWVEDVAATCKNTGTKHRICTVCEQTVSDTIPQKPHAYTAEWETDDEGHFRTCQNDDCGAVEEKQPHNLNENAFCTVCQLNMAEGLVFTENEDGTYAVSGYTGEGGAVVIPAKYKGVPVTVIGQKAFFNIQAITSVVIPEGITTIGQRAFAYCGGIRAITIPDSVTKIDVWGFSYTRVVSLVIPKSITTWGNAVFEGCSELVSVTFAEGATAVGSGAFFRCERLASVTLPTSIKTIGNGAFQYCTALSEITIPEGVETIGMYTFDTCASLTSIHIPKSVTSIGRLAFQKCERLATVSFAEESQLKSIDYGAFFGCKFASVSLPKTLTSIGEFAFVRCENLLSIRFAGTKEQWKTIDKGEKYNWALQTPSNLTVHCSDGNLTKYD